MGAADHMARAARLDEELRAFGRELVALNESDKSARGAVDRQISESRHALMCAVAAAGLHPRAHTTEEHVRGAVSVHAPSIALAAQEGQSE